MLGVWMVVLLTACSGKEESVTIQPSKGLFSASEITFSGLADGQSEVIRFEAPDAWTAEVHSLSSWLTVDKTHGEKGSASITLSPRSDNYGVTAREAELDIFINGYEAYTIKVYQQSASTGDIQVNGHVDNGVMRLSPTTAGTEFCDTIWVLSKKKWELGNAEGNVPGVLSFEVDGQSANGTETMVRLVVKANYSRFEGTTYKGTFYIRSGADTAIPIQVEASANAGVYQQELPMQGEQECTHLTFDGDSPAGRYAVSFYVESNVRWVLSGLPDWVESVVSWGSGVESITNVQSDGTINPMRHRVVLRMKSSAVSMTGRSGAVSIVDAKGQVLKTLSLTFAGVASSYIDYSLSIPAVDPYGNPWAFEAKSSYIDINNPNDYWKEMRHAFDVITAVRYSSLDDAPYHLLMVCAEGGMPRRQQVHWAHLEMGEKQEVLPGGLCKQEVYLCARDRGDADDQNGLTDPTETRYAFVYLVPHSVGFDDLWEADGRLKNPYADNLVLVAQKNDPNAHYRFALQEVDNEGTLQAPARGGALTLNIVRGSYTKCDVVVEQQGADGMWTAASPSVCYVDFTADEQGVPTSITFTLSENKKVTNPFTGVTTGAPRHLRVSINAFTGDETGSICVFVFYIEQDLN